MFHGGVLFTYNLHHSQKFDQLDELVQSTGPRDPNKFIKILCTENNLNRNDGNEIYHEPRAQVFLCNSLPVLNNIEILIIIGCVENDAHIYEEEKVNNCVDD